MRRAAVLTVSVILFSLLATGCASISDNATASLIKPDLAIEQIGATTFGGANAGTISNVGAAPVNLRVAVRNNSTETIRLKRLEVVSIGEGAYTVNNTSRPFDVELAPQRTESVQFWVPTTVENTITGAQGPVTMRVTAYFDSPVGQFREIYVLTVNDPLRPSGNQ